MSLGVFMASYQKPSQLPDQAGETVKDEDSDAGSATITGHPQPGALLDESSPAPEAREIVADDVLGRRVRRSIAARLLSRAPAPASASALLQSSLVMARG
jgi:hypothetical protein